MRRLTERHVLDPQVLGHLLLLRQWKMTPGRMLRDGARAAIILSFPETRKDRSRFPLTQKGMWKSIDRHMTQIHTLDDKAVDEGLSELNGLLEKCRNGDITRAYGRYLREKERRLPRAA